MNTRRSCWACNLRRQSCGRQSPRCARCVKYNFLCAWPDNGESVKQEAEGRKRGSGSAAAPRDKRQGVTQDLVVATAEEYLGLAAGGSYTPLRLEKVACARCRAHRRACDGARPACGRCAAKDLDCDYDTRKQSKRATSGQDDAEDGKIRRKSANKRVGMALLKVESAHTVESSSDFSDNFSRGLSRAQGGSPDRTPSPLLLQPIDQLEFPTWLDQSTINRLVRTFFDFKYLKTIPVVLHHSSFLDSLRSAPGEARPLLACIAYNCSLDVFAGNKSALRDLQRLAWRSLLSLRERFWAFNPPPLELAAVYIPALITAMYAAWKTAGLGAAKRFHEELVRAAYHVGIPSWSVSPPPPPTTARQWIAKNSLLFCWWNEAFGLDATFATGTQSSQLLLDPREWLDLELPVDPTIYNEVSMDAPLPDSISNLEKLTGRQVIGWTMLPPNSPERVALLANLQDAEGMWRRCGVFWGTPLSMALAQCLGESAKLRRWLVEKQLGPVWELGVAVQSGSPLHTFAAQMRQEILQSLADCRSMFPPVLAEAILNMDGYALVQNSQMNHWSSKTFGVTVGCAVLSCLSSLTNSLSFILSTTDRSGSHRDAIARSTGLCQPIFRLVLERRLCPSNGPRHHNHSPYQQLFFAPVSKLCQPLDCPLSHSTCFMGSHSHTPENC